MTQKSLIFIVLCCLSNIIVSQNLTDKISSSVCNCISITEDYTEQAIQSCFITSLEKYSEDFDKIEIEDQAQSLNHYALEKADKIFADVMLKLENDCDELFDFMIKMRETSIRRFRVDDPESKILSLTDSIEINPSTKFFEKRAAYYFVSNKISEARQDCISCLEIDSEQISCAYLLGWIEEENFNYFEAIRIYDQLAKQGLGYMKLYSARLKKESKK